jgi:hypothetical protein
MRWRACPIGFWLLIVKPERVRRAAENYADRLLETADVVARS